MRARDGSRRPIIAKESKKSLCLLFHANRGMRSFVQCRARSSSASRNAAIVAESMKWTGFLCSLLATRGSESGQAVARSSQAKRQLPLRHS